MINISQLLKIDVPIILASQSPRRKKLLEQLGFDFRIIPASIEENGLPEMPPELLAKELALRKAFSVAKKLNEKAIVLGADTIVTLYDKILNKPEDKADAFRMLRTLSGETHIVYTGIALVEAPGLRQVSTFQETEVTFRELDEDEIIAYVETGSPLDKAGAYGIQDDFGAVFVKEIRGCYYNIVGLPLELLYRMMKEFLDKKKF